MGQSNRLPELVAEWRDRECALHERTNGWFGFDLTDLTDDEIEMLYLREEGYTSLLRAPAEAVAVEGLDSYGLRKGQVVTPCTPELGNLLAETWTIISIRWGVAYLHNPRFGTIDIPATDLTPRG